jgi:hypothetical protein
VVLPPSIASLFRRWRDEHALERRATAVARAALAEPDESDVRWLAERGTHGDEDHARWEWRYARRAFAIIVAQRDALDDRTGSAVAAAVGSALARDPLIDASKRRVATRQFNDRLAGYSAILRDRDPSTPTSERLARALFGFAGTVDPSPADILRGGTALSSMLADMNATLALHFGAADLPADVAPSELKSSRS